MFGLNVMKSKDEAIEKFLKKYKEIYVVDVMIKDIKTNESVKQWYIYSDLEKAKNYLNLVKEHAELAYTVQFIQYLRRKVDDTPFLRIEYDDQNGNSIREIFEVTKITRAA